MILWLDAQLPPGLARWVNDQPFGLEALPVRDIGLRDANDREIFRQARLAGAWDIWLRLGNCSNEALQGVLSTTLAVAVDLLQAGEPWVEIR